MVASILSKALKKAITKPKSLKEKAKAMQAAKASKIKTKKPSTRDIQTKVLNKAKKQGMTAKNFRMQNPSDKDVKSLYKANPNLKVKDVDRLKTRKLEEASNKKLVTTPSGKFVQKVNKLYPNDTYKAVKKQIPYEAHQAIFKRIQAGSGTTAEKAKKYMAALDRYLKNRKKKK